VASERNGVAGIDKLLERLVNEASNRFEPPGNAANESERRRKRLDPCEPVDPEAHRVDPDDGLSILTTAAEIAGATGHRTKVKRILEGVERAAGATRWTKVNAIPTVAALVPGVGVREKLAEHDRMLEEQWTRIWEFARDPDEVVRREASDTMADDAYSAYRALEPGIDALLEQATLKSARNLSLDTVIHIDQEHADALFGGVLLAKLRRYGIGTEKKQVDSLCALGWVMPAIVSGLREQPLSMVERGFNRPHAWYGGDRDGGFAPEIEHGGGEDAEVEQAEPGRAEVESAEVKYAEVVNRARRALERLVTLAFQRRYPELEASVARGFKSDAMRHLDDPEQAGGPGFVESNRRLVSDICIDNASYWYARMVLHQALALYTVAGSSPQVAFDTFGRLLHRGGEPHPFVWRAARHARRAVRRYLIRSARWRAFVWADEGDAVGRRQAAMHPTAANLVGDVTVLLNLRQNAADDRRSQSSRTNRLPYCLSRSRNRLEILGAGCSGRCGSGLCPLAEAPVDEPDGKRTISRAFCRGQQKIAARHLPPWQKHISHKALKDFWYEMERRART
jgi:hypothetical protein